MRVLLIWMYNTKEEIKIREDFIETQKQSKEVKLEIWKNRKIQTKILEAILRVISPLL